MILECQNKIKIKFPEFGGFEKIISPAGYKIIDEDE